MSSEIEPTSQSETPPQKRKGLPKSGKYPFRKPRSQQKRQKGHAWALSGEWKPIFLDALSRCGVITKAAKAADVSLGAVSNHRRNDPDFEVACKEAMQVCRDHFVDHLYRWAIEGIEKFAWDKKNNEKVSLGKTPDPILLMFAIKQMDPSFRENYKPDDQAATQALTQVVVNFLRDGFNQDSDDQANGPSLEQFSVKQEALPAPETTDEKRARLMRELAELDTATTTHADD